jgi:acyl-coenzyme A thioesterase PaaI-like protein
MSPLQRTPASWKPPLPLEQLTNTFGFDSRCFVCDPDNTGGMRQWFFLDRDRGRVVAEFTPTADHSGAPNYAHGGATMAVLDDAMAWAIIATKERFGLSRRVETDFVRPVMVGKTYKVEAWVESFEDRSLEARAELVSSSGKLCVASRGQYMVMTLGEAQQAIGAGASATSSYTEQLQ